MREGSFGDLREGVKGAGEGVEFNWRHEGNWSNQDSPATEITQYFINVLPQGLAFERRGLVNFLEKELAGFKGRAIGLEIGGVGSRFFSDFSEDFFLRTTGVALTDTRSDLTKAEDAIHRHEVLPADIFSSRGWHKVLEGVKDKPHFILERMFGALNKIPDIPAYWGAWFQRLSGLLAEGGVMLIESPSIDSVDRDYEFMKMERWLGAIQAHPEQHGLELAFSDRSAGLGMWDKKRFLIRAKRIPGIELSLPPWE